jgi:hypothetical protein
MRRTLVRSLLQIVVNPYVRKGGGKSIDRVEIASSLDDSDDEIHEDVEDLELPELLLK